MMPLTMTSNTKVFTAFIIIIAAIVLGGTAISKNRDTNKSQTAQAQTEQTQPSSTPSNTKEFTVAGTPFKFVPAEIRVKKGDKVRITFKNDEGFHNLSIKDYNVATKSIKKGEQDTVEFIADKTGIFEYNCTVPTHTEKGMVGKLIVE